jgi:hypothetical protein
MTSPVETAQRLLWPGRLKTETEIGWPLAVRRNICVSPSPRTVPWL